MPLFKRLQGFWLGLLLSALLSCWVLPASAEDAATRAELASLRDSTKPADILRTLQLRYPDQPDAWHQFWANVTVEGLKEVVPGEAKGTRKDKPTVTHTELYLAAMRRMANQDAQGGLVAHIPNQVIDRGILKADSPFWAKMRPILEEIERKGQANIAEMDERIQQADERIQQADERIQQADERIQQARRNIEFWSNMAKRFEAIE